MQFKSFVDSVPVFTRRGAAVHIAIAGAEVGSMPVQVFCAASDAAAALAEELRRPARVLPFVGARREG